MCWSLAFQSGETRDPEMAFFDRGGRRLALLGERVRGLQWMAVALALGGHDRPHAPRDQRPPDDGEDAAQRDPRDQQH